MSTTNLIRDDTQPAPTPSAPQPVLPLAVIALVASAVGVAITAFVGITLRDFNHGGIKSTIIAVLIVVLALYPFVPTFKSFAANTKRSSLLGEKKLVPARRAAAGGREEAFIGIGYAAAVLIGAGVLYLALANKGSVAVTFFQQRAFRLSFSEIIHAFWTNIWVALVGEVFVLIFGLILAIMRMLPGRAGAPLRFIAIMYCDIFRAIPAIVTIYLIVFGLPLAIPAMSSWPLTSLGIVALTLTYSAYVAEVYRAGLSSIHPSQSAAARSLGLSYVQTLRKVLVPQAVRRVIPPLLNDFISLQKDTALLAIAAVPEAFLVATLWQSKLFNLSPVMLVAGFFILITIPQARFVDWLIDRDASRKAGG
ncbi:MAG: amino acid ABC transporter permease [Actinomycetota bacterium]|nr:amino acid ABC transporter permease [Actinomycetota bacterium]